MYRTKMLGVLVDNVLSWEDHTKNVCQKVVRSLYPLQQTEVKDLKFHSMPEIFFVNNWILPHFNYCSVVWGNCSVGLLHDLGKLQTRAACMILDLKLDSVNTAPTVKPSTIFPVTLDATTR